MARILMGIERPSTGRILLDGRDITDLDVTERANLGVSFAFQQPVRFKGISVKRLLETAAHKTVNREGLCEMLQKVGLCAQDYLHRDVDASPRLFARNKEASLIHEAAIGKIAGEQILKFRTLGLTEEEAEQEIIEGFLA